MKKRFMNMAAIVMIASLTLPGCIGEFALTRNLHEWNSSVSKHQIVNELIFLGTCWWLYPLFATVDALLLNSIEFWGGTNPVAMRDGEVENGVVTREGVTYRVTKSRNSISVVSDATGQKSEAQYFPDEQAWFVTHDGEKIAPLNTPFPY
ncbi:MAG: DUF3332 domain-containing protein [Odoribacteraceae bacterium]|jgi:hypothetical protein|nr:DUF3332 domain-containing protein [Odoribacteraceae bacterium]